MKKINQRQLVSLSNFDAICFSDNSSGVEHYIAECIKKFLADSSSELKEFVVVDSQRDPLTDTLVYRFRLDIAVCDQNELKGISIDRIWELEDRITELKNEIKELKKDERKSEWIRVNGEWVRNG